MPLISDEEKAIRLKWAEREIAGEKIPDASDILLLLRELDWMRERNTYLATLIQMDYHEEATSETA